MAKRKTRRHPGVVLIKPDEKARTGWRVRYRDPDTGQTVKRTIDPSLRTRAQRESYACKLSDKLARRRMELETPGTVRKTGKPIDETIEIYFRAHPDMADLTRKEYRASTGKLVAWCAKHNIRTADDLDQQKLMAFREYVINEPKRRAVLGGKRGQRASTGERRAPRTVNKQLICVGKALKYLVTRQAFSQLNREAVRAATEHYDATPQPHQVKAARPLKVREVERLLEACIEHDETTFSMTRAEKVSGEKGRTQRYQPIGPYAAFVLLTGMAPREALVVEWKHVDFDRNLINVGSWMKRRQPREVTMAESPMLQRLLDAQWEQTGGKGRIWPMTYAQTESALARLKREYGAPDEFLWYGLRKTCQSTLASSPSIYGAASIFLAAKRGGHSVAVCEKHYANALKLVDPDAPTIEGALGVEELLDQIIEDLEAVEVAA